MAAIEPGLRLYEEESVKGIEFPVGGRFIDLLGVDEAGALVVIELKVSRGYDRVVGQLLRYGGWITTASTSTATTSGSRRTCTLTGTGIPPSFG
jgi:RecB family endonuclease NucS